MAAKLLFAKSGSRSAKDETRTRFPWIGSIVLVLAFLMGGCSWFLPSVPDEVTNSVSGEGVRIVARETDTNPTEEWIYTFLLLEVTEPGQRLEIVAEALRTNGWEVRESPGPNVLLVAIKPSVADLTLVALETFLEPSPITSVQRRFAGFPQDSDKGYFVALIMPLGE